ncbi:hypothetical protein HYFRA_00007241 [Hymenoscyphus fraxineus]|uniref:Uncharacterized protein n=1 Tax=Hymenoscyphus fraxineus TaxID=746836 RepID=A0A9N9KXD2_9HELO|nr:hypothetical protein HYFRA_00007241 [Hymenoscyphus fraxineus]
MSISCLSVGRLSVLAPLDYDIINYRSPYVMDPDPTRCSLVSDQNMITMINNANFCQVLANVCNLAYSSKLTKTDK